MDRVNFSTANSFQRLLKLIQKVADNGKTQNETHEQALINVRQSVYKLLVCLNCLFVCLDDLSHKGTRQNSLTNKLPHKCLVVISQFLSLMFCVYDNELHT